MSNSIRNFATRYVHGLMSADQARQLEDISSTIGGISTGTSLLFQSATINVLTATHLTSSTGSFNILTSSWFSASRATVFRLTSSYFSASSGGANNFSATTLTVQDLVVINSNVTGSASVPDPFSGNIIRGHIISGSHFEFITGNINLLTATSISSTLDLQTLKFTGSFFTASTGTVHNLTSSFATGTEFRARTGTFHLLNGFILTATHLNSNTGSFNIITSSWFSSTNIAGLDGSINRLTATSISSTLDLQTLKFTGSFFTASTGTVHNLTSSYVTGTEFRARTGSFSIGISHIFTATHLTSSTGSFNLLTSSWHSSTKNSLFEISSSYFSATRGGAVNFSATTLTVQDLIAINTNLTASIPDPLSGNIVRAHILSASHFQFITGNILNLTATSIQTPRIASTDVLSINGVLITLHADDGAGAVVINAIDLIYSNSISNTMSSSDYGRFHILSASHFNFITGNINKLTATSISSTLDLQTLKFTGSFFTASTGTIHNLTSSFITGTEFRARTGTFHLLNGFILTATHLNSNTGSFNIITSSWLSSTNVTVLNGNINRLTSTSISSTLDLQTLKFTGSFFTASTGTVHVLTASYIQAKEIRATNNGAVLIYGETINFNAGNGAEEINFNASTLNFSGSIGESSYLTFLSASTGTMHNITSSYFGFQTGTISNLELTGVKSVSPVRGYVTDTNFSCSASTTEIIPLLSQSIAAGEVWQISANLICVMSGTGGFRFTVFAPTGSLIVGFVHGKTSTPNTDSRTQLFRVNEETITTLGTANGTRMPQEFYFSIRNGNTAGDIQLGIRRITSSEFCHVSTGSYMVATKCTIGDTGI